MPLRQVNLHSATTEELFERLAWFYATANQVQIYDAEGQSHSLSTLVSLSREKIPFPTRFALRKDIVQKQTFIQTSIPKLDATKSLLYLWRLVQIRKDSRKHV